MCVCVYHINISMVYICKCTFVFPLTAEVSNCNYGDLLFSLYYVCMKSSVMLSLFYFSPKIIILI